MASQLTIQELAIADLGINEENENFADAVACVQAYWSQASLLSEKSQNIMRRLIINQEYAHTGWSKKHACHHRLYRTAAVRSHSSTWPVFLILNALYKNLPVPYLKAIEERELPTTLEDHTDDYLAAFPDTVLPTTYDTNTPEGKQYRTTYGKLSNTPTTFRRKDQVATAPMVSTAPPVGRRSSSLSSISSSSPSSSEEEEEGGSPAASQQTFCNVIFVKPETLRTPDFQPASLISPAPLTTLSEKPDPKTTTPPEAAAPDESVQTASQPRSMQPSVPKVVDDADAERDAIVNSTPSGRRKRSRSGSAPVLPFKKQNTSQETYQDMIQRLQSPATASAKHKQSAAAIFGREQKQSAEAISRLEQRVEILKNEMVAVLEVVTDQIKVLKEKVATLEDAWRKGETTV